MSKEQVQRQESKKFVSVVALVLALFVGSSMTAFGVINSDINQVEQQLQQRINS